MGDGRKQTSWRYRRRCSSRAASRSLWASIAACDCPESGPSTRSTWIRCGRSALERKPEDDRPARSETRRPRRSARAAGRTREAGHDRAGRAENCEHRHGSRVHSEGELESARCSRARFNRSIRLTPGRRHRRLPASRGCDVAGLRRSVVAEVAASQRDEDILQADVPGRQPRPAGAPRSRARRAEPGWRDEARRPSARSRRSRLAP